MIRNLRLAAISVALAAMVLRAMIPSGWMPSTSQGGIALTICTLNGAVEAVLGPDGKPLPPSSDQSRPQDVCVFGAAPHLAELTGQTALPAPVNVVRAVQTPRADGISRADAAYSPHAPRAPPSQA